MNIKAQIALYQSELKQLYIRYCTDYRAIEKQITTLQSQCPHTNQTRHSMVYDSCTICDDCGKEL